MLVRVTLKIILENTFNFIIDAKCRAVKCLQAKNKTQPI